MVIGLAVAWSATAAAMMVVSYDGSMIGWFGSSLVSYGNGYEWFWIWDSWFDFGLCMGSSMTAVAIAMKL